MKTYIICDSFDGRTLRLLTRVSSRKLARRAAIKYSKECAHDGIDLIECRDRGERLHVQHYAPRK